MRKRIGFEGERFVHINKEVLDRVKYSSLMSGLYIHSMGYYPHAEHHYVNRPQGAQEYILIYCIEGGGTVKIADELHRLEANQLIMIPPHTPHSYFADNATPWSIYWVHFLGHSADYFAESFRYPFSITTADNSRAQYRLSLFEEIFFTLNSGSDTSHIHYANCCFMHFLATIKYFNIYRRSTPTQEKSYGDKMSIRLIHYMSENIDKQLTSRDFATYVGLSESYLYRCFFKEMGIAPSGYFMNLKVKKACVLLRDTNLLIKDIALKLGYKEQFYFSKIFTKVMGVSPSNYRKNKTK